MARYLGRKFNATCDRRNAMLHSILRGLRRRTAKTHQRELFDRVERAYRYQKEFDTLNREHLDSSGCVDTLSTELPAAFRRALMGSSRLSIAKEPNTRESGFSIYR